MKTHLSLDLKSVQPSALDQAVADTLGEVFDDGTLIEPVRLPNGTVGLMSWDGTKQSVGATAEHSGRLYRPRSDNTFLRDWTLPAGCRPYRNTRAFLTSTCNAISEFAGVEGKSSELIGRIVLCSAVPEALPILPALVIVGADKTRATRLTQVLACLCRHPVTLTAVTPAALCSLPSGIAPTYIISQTNISDSLQQFLQNISRPGLSIPFRGGLRNISGVQIIHSDSISGESWRLRAVEISLTPTTKPLPVFDLQIRRRVAEDGQGMLLAFRGMNLDAALRLQVDTSRISVPLRDLAHALCAATPDDLELQNEVFALLRDQDTEIRSDRYIALDGIAAEAILVAADKSRGEFVYVSELAEIAQVLLNRRGSDLPVDPAIIGRRLSILGFTRTRDMRGKKLRLTDSVIARASQAVSDFGIGESPAPESAIGDE